jgi:tetrapyrrole methylase family protein / MazG family protein
MVSERPRLTIVGLGPGHGDLVTVGTVAAIASHPVRFVRTLRHPSADVVGEATSFDSFYDTLDSFDDVYRAIVEELVAAALRFGSGQVLYAVPGSPVVAEHTVELLLSDTRIEAVVVPAMSFVDLTWARLRVDPQAGGVRLVDGMRFADEATGERGPLLVSQCFSRAILSEIKCSTNTPPESVTVLHRLGLPDEAITTVPWDDLDRTVSADHLTSLWIPEWHSPLREEMQRLEGIMAALRADCPWDHEQTHATLAPYAVEEAYELAEVISADAAAGDDTHTDHLIEELGDLLFQTVFHACIGTEDGRFSLADIAKVLNNKLIRRHPHVFGDVHVDDADEVKRNWELIKAAERGSTTSAAGVIDPMEGLTDGLPSMTYAVKVIRRAVGVGLAVESVSLPAEYKGDRVGDYLLSVVLAVRAIGRDPEVELRAAAGRLRDRAREIVSESA